MSLADLLGKYAGPNTVVFGLGKGGTLVAAELAHWLGASLDLLLVQALDLPCDEKTMIGAIGPGRGCVLDEEIIDLLDIESDAIGTLRCQADAELDQQNLFLRGGRALQNVKNQTAILVDDVIASTVKIRAAVLYLQQQAPHSVIVAAPVITTSALRCLRSIVNDVVAVDEPETAPHIGRIYVNAITPSDTEVRRVLGVSEPTDELLTRLPTDDS